MRAKNSNVKSKHMKLYCKEQFPLIHSLLHWSKRIVVCTGPEYWLNYHRTFSQIDGTKRFKETFDMLQNNVSSCSVNTGISTFSKGSRL